jgi:hypothetical protein
MAVDSENRCSGMSVRRPNLMNMKKSKAPGRIHPGLLETAAKRKLRDQGSA